MATLLLLVSVWVGVWNPSRDEIEAKYIDEHARIVVVDGTPMHVRDEGRGPAIVLIHGHMGSLHQWDGWSARLKDRYRIIRFDLPPFGLSGPDPTDDYGLSPRTQQLVDDLIDGLELDSFVLGGTSIGASLAARYAATRPDRVRGLILSTLPAVFPTQRRSQPLSVAMVWVGENVLRTYYPKFYWRQVLRGIFGDPAKVTDEIVTRYTELNGQPGQAALMRKQMAANRRLVGANSLPQTLGQLRMPVLLQWAGKSPVLPEQLIERIKGMFNAPLTLVQYPDLGHKLMIEDPERTVADVERFLAELQ
ncbi:MAG: alpha/beta hydrolase [Rhodospirillaceae bacterium]|nr:alpha/beta hydrolase [Rhodospirillaceae bacterium]